MKKLSIKGHIWEFLTALIIFLLMQPGIMWGIDPTLLRTVLIFVMMLKLDIHEKKNMTLLFYFFAVLSIYPITHHNSLFGFIYFTTLALMPFMRSRHLSYSFLLFKRILAYITLISIIFWIIVVVLRIDLPHTIINPLNELKTFNYRSYLFLVVPMNLNIDFIKFNCVFDEPGVVGTYSLLMLIANNFDWKNRESQIFLVSGLISFSFFFYLGLIVFTLINIFTSEAKKRYKVMSVIGAMSFLIAVQVVPVLNEVVGYRLEYDSTAGKFVGDNRSSDALDDYIVSIRGSSEYLWGANEDIVEYYLANAGLNTAILRYGVVFIVSYIVFFILYCYYKTDRNRKESMLFLIAILATIYQRPGLVNPPFIFMFVGIVINRVLISKSLIENEIKWEK
jgi:hypothetical protein